MCSTDHGKTRKFQSGLLNILLSLYFQNRLGHSDIQFHLHKYTVKCGMMFHKKKVS